MRVAQRRSNIPLVRYMDLILHISHYCVTGQMCDGIVARSPVAPAIMFRLIIIDVCNNIMLAKRLCILQLYSAVFLTMPVGDRRHASRLGYPFIHRLFIPTGERCQMFLHPRIHLLISSSHRERILVFIIAYTGAISAAATKQGELECASSPINVVLIIGADEALHSLIFIEGIY